MDIFTNNCIKSSDALSELRNVLDPEIGLNIVDLGLVYGIDFDDEGKVVLITMTLTTQFCPMGESILKSAKQALETAFPGYQVEVDLVFDPLWNRDMISEEGRIYLMG